MHTQPEPTDHCMCGDCLSCEVRSLGRRSRAKREQRLLERRLVLVTAALEKVQASVVSSYRD